VDRVRRAMRQSLSVLGQAYKRALRELTVGTVSLGRSMTTAELAGVDLRVERHQRLLGSGEPLRASIAVTLALFARVDPVQAIASLLCSVFAANGAEVFGLLLVVRLRAPPGLDVGGVVGVVAAVYLVVDRYGAVGTRAQAEHQLREIGAIQSAQRARKAVVAEAFRRYCRIARAVGRPFEFSHTSPTRGSSPPSSSTLPLAMPHPTSPAHRPDPELLPIHPPRLANSRSSPKTVLAYTIPAYAFILSDCQLSSPRTVRLLPLHPLLARHRRPPATPPAEQYFLYTLDRRNLNSLFAR